MTYEWAMSDTSKELRISSDSKGINAIHGDEIVSVTWKQVFDAIDLYREDILLDMKIKKFKKYGWVRGL